MVGFKQLIPQVLLFIPVNLCGYVAQSVFRHVKKLLVVREEYIFLDLWLGMAHARICQIANMLLLSPKIQEDILLSYNKALFNVPEYRLRDITTEVEIGRASCRERV